MFRNQAKSDQELLDDEIALFPMLVSEPWRINELISEESIVQRYRLNNFLSWFRICVATVSLILFWIFGSKFPFNPFAFNVILLSYIFLVYGLKVFSNRRRDKIYSINFLITLAEISLLGYLGYLYPDKILLSFMFLSVALSAMLLPLWRMLVTVFYSCVIISANILLASEKLHNLILLLKDDFKAAFSYVVNIDRGLLNIFTGLFVLALIVNRLAVWSFKNDVRARFRYKQMRQLISFNRAIIEHLRSGVIVVSENGKVLSINERSVTLLQIKTSKEITELSQLSKELDARLRDWLSGGVTNQEPYRHNDKAEEVFLSFSMFGHRANRNIVMITLESVTDTLQQSQNAKLAALGRLTAGVAHEIRNPLSAINSASQLLSETLKEQRHQKLATVIVNNVKRTDQIIADILGLFKSSKTESRLLPVKETLARHVKEFIAVEKNKQFNLEFDCKVEEQIFCYFDTGHLQQIIWNLLQNSIKYSGVDNLNLSVVVSVSESRKSLFIDVIDNGHGIDPNVVSQIFEPFFSGGQGSGLGLYLVRELCGTNNANIAYSPIIEDTVDENDLEKEPVILGARFRITTKVYFSKRLKTKIY